ncbi:hypothetical protein HOP50_02g14110 [Chloropicon primus]|uniref:Uncharacterized protein n=1 Tax=Chloropicon primus TaxID=1764295 RepID=A0A5B8MGU3_9CHLO|nr:hypothetical protein A3770_02p14230 [Chloropicon primus]UPQ98113.1 hypothetical protein HOP50_02g14110 [Chloropicon primus]|eukprot:QDZ18905.1 hypothetical protein A3770_02p14230 [Chloropicon primus]
MSSATNNNSKRGLHTTYEEIGGGGGMNHSVAARSPTTAAKSPGQQQQQQQQQNSNDNDNLGAPRSVMLSSSSSSFDLSKVDLPKPGTSLTFGAKEVRVKVPLGRNGRPLRSRLFEIGAVFEPPLSPGGQDFLCCVPVTDPATGELKRCGALLKIPKGSLGNPLRHVKKKHQGVYACIIDDSGRDRSASGGVRSAASGAKRQRKSEGQAHTRPSGKAAAVLRSCVAFCARQLLPLDVVGQEAFAEFVGSFGKPGQGKSLRNHGSTGVMHELLLEEFEALRGKLRRRLEHVSRQHYLGLPFLDVVVDPRFVPGPAARLSFVNEEGDREEFVLVSKHRDSLDGEPFAEKAFGEYDLGEGSWSSWVSSVSVVAGDGGLRRARGATKIEEDLASYLSPHNAAAAAEALGRDWVCRAFFERRPGEAAADDLAGGDLLKELEDYEALAKASRPGDSEAFWRSKGASKCRTLHKLACSVCAAGGPPPSEPIQTPRDIRILEAGDFVGYEATEDHKRAILFLKYNPVLLSPEQQHHQ